MYLADLYLATRSERSTEAPPARLLEQVEVLTGHQLDPHTVVDRLGRQQALRRQRSLDSIWSAQTSARSPSRIAAPDPKSSGGPIHCGVRCNEANLRWTLGAPRRVSEPSMTSSWISAHACSSSRAATA